MSFSLLLSEQISCVKREISMRERVYPRLVAAGKMTQLASNHELATMREVLQSLERLKEPPLLSLFRTSFS
jgi:hypothetical protein